MPLRTTAWSSASRTRIGRFIYLLQNGNRRDMTVAPVTLTENVLTHKPDCCFKRVCDVLYLSVRWRL